MTSTPKLATPTRRCSESLRNVRSLAFSGLANYRAFASPPIRSRRWPQPPVPVLGWPPARTSPPLTVATVSDTESPRFGLIYQSNRPTSRSRRTARHALWLPASPR